jgi:hypothetical protein
MKPKILLLSFICVAGCLQSRASGNDPGEPGKSINEVSGSIVDANSKKPLKEVTITAYSANKKEKFVLSDEFGHFEFDELKTGTYKLVFEKDGYRKMVREKVFIKTDETFQLRIEMIESPDFELMPSPYHFFDTAKL